MQSLTSEETLKAKKAFEAYARSLGVTILHYHADNGRFADNAFLKSVAESNQSISFVESTPTSKMVEQKRGSEIYKTKRERS